MNENEYLAGTVNEQLEAGLPLVIISIMNIQGSAPRHSGTKMVIGADGKSYGTIGGSLLEAIAIRESQDVLSGGKPKVLSYDLTGKDTTSSEMICGGKAEVLLDYLSASAKNREFSRQWLKASQQGKDFYILTLFKRSADTLKILDHGILYANDDIFACASLIGSDVKKLKPELHNISAAAVLPFKDVQVMIDRIRKIKTLYCFGAGHVAVPTAHLAKLTGFRVVILDDRPEFANSDRFPEAYNIIVLNDFNRVFDGLEIDGDSFIVILTRGHRYDREVLEQSLKTEAGYIGMISSRQKKETLYKELMVQGIGREQLEQVHSPIGINIGGETPEEIAVSIVAELISERSKRIK